jgi:phosphoribosylformylglycinamidine cyclo-ligase
MAHITGGGFTDNIPRVLSRNTSAVIDCSSWTPPHVFRFIQREGKVSSAEMYRVFNMGIGFVIIVREKDASTAMSVLKEAGEKPVLIGYICEGRRQVILKGLK